MLWAGLPGSGNKVENLPARMLLAALLINHTPMSKEAKRAGDNLFTILNPIGDRESSPQVWIAYIAISQNILTLELPVTPAVPKAIIAYPIARSIKPSACFIGDAGSFPIFPNFSQSMAKRGAKHTTQIGLTLWNQAVLKSIPNRFLSTLCSAK